MLRNNNKRITYSTLSNKQANDGKLKFKRKEKGLYMWDIPFKIFKALGWVEREGEGKQSWNKPTHKTTNKILMFSIMVNSSTNLLKMVKSIIYLIPIHKIAYNWHETTMWNGEKKWNYYVINKKIVHCYLAWDG